MAEYSRLTGGIVLQYDDSFEGLLTAIFESYRRKPMPVSVVGAQHQRLLGVEYETITTDDSKAERVIAGIEKTIGGDVYERIWTGFLSCQPDKGDIIYQYIRLGMHLGHAVHQHLTDERVMAMDKLASLVGKESSQLIEFVRFSRMEGGVYYAKIQPDNEVIPLMMPFFVDRFQTHPFIIHDTDRQSAGVSTPQGWFLTSTADMELPSLADDEWDYRRLWKRFYDTIAIKERINPQLRRQHMPKRFWRNITEMTMPETDQEAASPTLPSDISRAAVQNVCFAPQPGDPPKLGEKDIDQLQS